MRGDIVCAVQECKPVEMHGKNCTARIPGPGECCPQIYECESDMQASTTLFDDTMAATTLGYRGDDSVLTTTSEAAEHLEKDFITTEPSGATGFTAPRIDDTENEIHDKDYDHMTGAVKPARTNVTAPQIPTATESVDSTTILSKLDEIAATTILSESGPVSDEQITTVLPIGRPQEISTEKAATEGESMLDNLYTTIKSIVELATTTLSPVREPEQKPHVDEEDSFLSNVIPGEGDCLENGVSYSNNTSVPPRNVCDESCLCHNSLVRCEQVKCAPMPPNAENCKVLLEDGLCCPSYHCESMEFSTGTPPTHPAESQVIHRDDEGAESTTVMQPSEEEQQQTTAQSPKAPISSKFDDSSEMTPESITEGQLEKQTAAPELEGPSTAKLPSEETIEFKFDEQPQQTEQPSKEETTSQPLVLAEGTTQTQSHTVERIHPESERPEIEQQTTERIADELPQEKTSTQLPERDVSEISITTAAPSEKLPEESQPLTTQQPIEEIATTQKVQQADEISTEVPQQPAAPLDEQKPAESITTESPASQKTPVEPEIQTEQQPTVQPEATTAAPSGLKDEISTEQQPEAPKPEESATTQAPSIENLQREGEITTEASQPTQQPEEEKPQEIGTTAQPTIQQEEEISTEQQPEAPKPQESATTLAPSIDILQREGEITTAQPTQQPEEPKPQEIGTTVQPSIQQEEEISTEKPLEIPKPVEIATTQGPSVEKEQTEAPIEEVTKQEERITTEKSQPSSPEPTEKEQIEQTTVAKLAEEPIEAITTRITEEQPPKAPLDSEVSSTEKPYKEDEYTEKATENLIPDSSTDGYVKPELPKEEISTEKHIEPEQVTTEKVVLSEQETTEQGLPQTTISSISSSSQPSTPVESDEYTTKAPQPIPQEPTATEKEPALVEISSQHAPIDEYQTEKDLYIPPTESFQPQGTEPSATQIPDEKEKQPEEEKVTEQSTAAPATSAPEVSSTERAAPEESTTLSSSKLNLGEVSKDGEVSGTQKPDLDEIENITTEKAQQPELPSSTEVDQKPKEQVTTEQPTQTEKISTEAPLEKESISTEKQPEPEATTMYVFPSKQEDMEIITEKVIPSQPEDIEMVTMQKEIPEPELGTTQAPIESEATTLSKVFDEQPSQKPVIPSEEQSTIAAPLATEKQPTISSEQTTFGAITEKSTEPTEIQEPVPTTQPPPRPELESDSQMHVADEKQPEESASTTEAPKQEEPAEIITTAAPSIASSENVNRFGEESTTAKLEEPQQPITEAPAVSSESPKEHEQPHVELATTEPAIVDITTLMTKIRDEVVTEKQEQPQPEQQTEKQQPTEQPPPEQQTEKQQPTEQPQPSDEIVTTEKAAVPLDREATTQSQQPIEPDVTTEPAKREEIPSEQPTARPQEEQTTQAIDLTSSSAAPEPAQTTQAPIQDEQQSTQSPEIDLKDRVELTTPKEESSEAPVGSSSPETVPIAPETTAFDQESPITTTSAPIKLAETSISPEEQKPDEAITTERIAQPQQEEQEPSLTTAQPSPSLFDGTTIKSVVELLTTLHPREPEKSATESEATTAAQPQQPGVFTTEPSLLQENKTSEEATTPQIYAAPPESSNNIPLIREPSHDETTITKLAESFDTTTLPSILLTSSHTDRISDSTTIKNTQNEIMEASPTTTQSPQQPFTEEMVPSGSPEVQQPTYQQPFDSGYGNVPSQYPDEEYGDEEEPTVFGPGTCRYGGKLYVSAQQIPRDDPCDFCFCFRSDIICLQQSCPPPINGCHEEPIQGFCCPRYECPVSMALVLNATTTTTTTLPPYLSHFQRNSGKLTRSGCQVQGQTYKIGERVTTASGPCMDCMYVFFAIFFLLIFKIENTNQKFYFHSYHSIDAVAMAK